MDSESLVCPSLSSSLAPVDLGPDLGVIEASLGLRMPTPPVEGGSRSFRSVGSLPKWGGGKRRHRRKCCKTEGEGPLKPDQSCGLHLMYWVVSSAVHLKAQFSRRDPCSGTFVSQTSAPREPMRATVDTPDPESAPGKTVSDGGPQPPPDRRPTSTRKRRRRRTPNLS